MKVERPPLESLLCDDEVLTVKHLVMPGYEKTRAFAFEGESIASFLERADWDFHLPTICVRNGLPVMRKEWQTTTITGRDRVLFYSRPYGGGSGASKAMEVGALVAVIALSAFAPWAAGAMFASGTFGYFATVAGITLAGGYLISTFLLPKPASNDSAPISQLYTLTASGNTANPFQTIPVQYGRLKQTPPYASLPWTDYVGNDAYLNVILALGQGKYNVEQILIDDTILWDHVTGSIGWTNVQVQICQPGDPFTLFPANVTTASEVSGQELVDTNFIGFFAANPPGTVIYSIVVDFLFPGGLQGTDGNDGSKFAISCHLFVDIQQIDDSGTPIGSVVQAVTDNLTLNTNQPFRESYTISLANLSLPNGRYQVRVHRNPGPAADTQHNVDVVLWQQLRSYVVAANTYADSAVVGVRMLATSQLSENGSHQFGVIQERILPVWNGSAFVEQPTKNAWWAFYDAATNANYGAQWPVSKIDFQTIVDQATAADTRGDAFNYRFDSAITFQEAFDKILASNRAKTRWLGDVLSAVRDEWQAIPQMLISDQQIVRGTLEVDYQINDDDNVDSVQLQFLNENTWEPAQLQYPKNNPPTFVAQAPATIQLDGVTDPTHVHRELQFWYKQSQLRRVKVRFDTEHDGRILSFGSVVKVQSQLPSKWGVSGEIVSYNSSTHVLTLDRNLTSESGQHYIELRDKRGRYFGPVMGTLGGSGNQITLDVTDLGTVETGVGYTIEDALARLDGAEPPSFVWGLQSNLSKQCIVLSGKPSGDKVSLELVADSLAVHDDSDSDVPVLPTPPSYNDPRVPIITNLVANFISDFSTPKVTASWWPAKGAVFYRAQVSYDAGTSWVTLSDNIQTPNIAAIVSLANLRLRVAGVGAIQGPWSFVDVTVPDMNSPFVSIDNMTAGLHDYVANQLTKSLADLTAVVQQIASIAAEDDAAKQTQVNQLRSTASTAAATVETLASTVANDEAAFATYQTTVTAQFGTLTSSVATNATAIATQTGVIDALFTLTLDVNGYVSGFESTNDGTTSDFQVISSHFIVAEPGTTGGTPISVFDIGTVGGVASIVFSGNMFADGTITANTLAAGSVTTNALAANAVTAVKIAAGSIDASKIVAGSISTGEIAVGGVDITNLVAGAATKIYTNVFGSSTVSAFAGTMTCNIQSGSALIIVMAAAGGTSGAGGVTFELLVDGSAISPSWPILYPGAGQTGTTFMWVASSLSAGNHTFEPLALFGTYPWNSAGGVMVVIDLRR